MSQHLEYLEFIEGKLRPHVPCGREVTDSDINDTLFPFQRAIVRWACRMGRAAVFADCGLGKSFMQIEWARLMGTRSLIFAPLTVAEQTIAEAARLGVEVRYIRSGAEMALGISQLEAAFRAGMPQSNWSMLETGSARWTPSREALARIADALSRSVDEALVIGGFLPDGTLLLRLAEWFQGADPALQQAALDLLNAPDLSDEEKLQGFQQALDAVRRVRA